MYKNFFQRKNTYKDFNKFLGIRTKFRISNTYNIKTKLYVFFKKTIT